ncbi:MAG: 2OG-Fe dioxygenase family protein [Kofleriaceae bacterium]
MVSTPELVDAIREHGYVFVTGGYMQELLGELIDWPAFAESWNDLHLDRYMADGGRYRRRRHAIFAADATGVHRMPHGAHFQSVDYNSLNGGIERWFEPIGESQALPTILAFAQAAFEQLAAPQRWHVEVHQFRIEARAGEVANPTPEGPHRDGVDYVLVLLVQRRNIASGTTTVHSPEGTQLGSFTLAHPFDATLVDDARVYHGVTPVEAVDPQLAAFRDVLVVTFRRA